MTDLLAPRYKVIALFPNTDFEVGEIIEPGDRAAIKFYDTYPHLFRRLHWSEYRQPEEMPTHIRFGNLESRHRIYAVKKYDLQGIDVGHPGAWAVEPDDYWLPLTNAHNCYPATAAEYETYKSTHP
jgi:hypothetical protein